MSEPQEDLTLRLIYDHTRKVWRTVSAQTPNPTPATSPRPEPNTLPEHLTEMPQGLVPFPETGRHARPLLLGDALAKASTSTQQKGMTWVTGPKTTTTCLIQPAAATGTSTSNATRVYQTLAGIRRRLQEYRNPTQRREDQNNQRQEDQQIRPTPTDTGTTGTTHPLPPKKRVRVVLPPEVPTTRIRKPRPTIYQDFMLPINVDHHRMNINLMVETVGAAEQRMKDILTNLTAPDQDQLDRMSLEAYRLFLRGYEVQLTTLLTRLLGIRRDMARSNKGRLGLVFHGLDKVIAMDITITRANLNRLQATIKDLDKPETGEEPPNTETENPRPVARRGIISSVTSGYTTYDMKTNLGRFSYVMENAPVRLEFAEGAPTYLQQLHQRRAEPPTFGFYRETLDLP